MKSIIAIVVAFTVISCGNQKAEISKQIEDYKDSLRVVADSMKVLTDEGMKETAENAPPENIFSSDTPVKWEPKYDVGKEKDRINRRYRNEVKWKHFRKKIDSLELELKKY